MFYIKLISSNFHLTGLTIERKTPGQKYANKDRMYSIPMVDKVEITKIPVGGSTSSLSTNGTSSPRLDFYSSSTKSSSNNVLDLSTSNSRGDSPLNLSVKTSAASVTRNKDANLLYSKTNNDGSKIPSEYYACKYNPDSHLFYAIKIDEYIFLYS